MARKSGTMLWFNEEKGYGFIQSEDDERVYLGAWTRIVVRQA